MDNEHHAVYEILRDFAVGHLTSRTEFHPYESTREIDKVLERIDRARHIGGEPDEGPDEFVPGADDLEHFKLRLLANPDQDVYDLIIECQRFVEEGPDPAGGRGSRIEELLELARTTPEAFGASPRQVIAQVEIMKRLEAKFAADIEACRALSR